MDARTLGRTIFVTRSGDDNKLDGSDHVLPPMPRLDLVERIRTNQEEQPAAGWECLACALNRIDRVALAFVILETRGLKQWVARASQLNHPEAILIRSKLAREFMRRVSCGDEQHAIKRESMRGLSSHGQVRVVYGIERAAKECDSQTAAPSEWVGAFTGFSMIPSTGAWLGKRERVSITVVYAELERSVVHLLESQTTSTRPSNFSQYARTPFNRRPRATRHHCRHDSHSIGE